MNYSKHAAALVILGCCAAYLPAVAGPQARQPAPPATDQKDAADKQPARRRSVQQVIDAMPAAAPPASEPYRPTLHSAPPSPEARLPAPPGVPPGPVQINSCDAGGCTDIDAIRYNSGVGNAAVTGQGRLCIRSGSTMQCF